MPAAPGALKPAVEQALDNPGLLEATQPDTL